MAEDVFPSTLNTWIGDRLDDAGGGRDAINRHIMEVYAWPLTIYIRGHTGRGSAEPEEIVAEFFADRLGREDFIEKWRASGLRLRRWLMNGINFYVRERRRHEALRSGHEILEDDGGSSHVDDPAAAMSRAFAQSVVSRALNDGEERCRAQGRSDHWGIFIRHHLDGRSYEELVSEFGCEPSRAAVMARTAARAFRSALRDIIERDGAAAEEVDEEIERLIEEIRT